MGSFLKKINIWLFINAFLFSSFVVIGICFDKYGTITYIFKNYKIIILNFLFFIFLLVFFYSLLKIVESFLDNYKKTKRFNNKVINYIFYKHPFSFMMGCSILTSGIYLIFFYPGTVSFDGCWQLNSYFRTWTFNDHHPAMLSILMGNIYKLGIFILNENLGIFIYIGIQVLINGLVYGYVLKIMKELNVSLVIRILTFIFFSLFPFWIINSITYIKDTIYYLIFLFLFTFQYYHLKIKNDFQKKHFIILLILYLLLYLWRNTGFYIGIIMSIGLLISNFKNKKRCLAFLIILISILSFNCFYHSYFLVKWNIAEGLVREKLSIPLQETARYIKYYAYDISEEEEKGIKAIFESDLKTIGDAYNPNISDSVKELMKDYPTKEELKLYFKAWRTMFIKHPSVYVDATINNTYAYFFSKHKNFMGEELGFYDLTNYELNIYYNQKTANYRNMLESFSSFLCHTKIIGLLYGCPIYIWTIMILTSYLLAKRKYGILVYYIPLYLTIAMALVSPVNGHMRYLEPVAVSMPITLAFFFYELESSHNKKDA